MELFAKRGFSGTTTRDLATHADVNEAIIFRHFTNKTELYRAILEEKVHQGGDEQHTKEVAQVAQTGDTQALLEFIGHRILEQHEQDSTFMRLLLFSALEGHELSDMFFAAMATRDPMTAYLEKRMEAGEFRRMDPVLAARAFFGMFMGHIQMQELFGQKKIREFDRSEVVRTFVSIYLSGMKA